MSATSVPRWSRTPPAADLSGVAFAVVTVGTAACQAAASWLDQLGGRPVQVLHSASADELLVEVADLIAGARVGWRFLISAPEAELAVLRAILLRGGVLGAEITAHVSEDRLRRVRCTHCATITVTEAPISSTARCEGCGLNLHIYHHFSRRLASYLGFSNDAETLGGPA